MNYVSFCRMYFSVTHIPVSLMKKNEAIYSSIGEVCSVKAARYWEMAPIDDTPNFYRYSPDIEYGVVHILGTDYAIVLGPAFSVPVTSEIIRTYMHENAIALELSLIHISEPTRHSLISYAVFCLKKFFLMIRRPPRSTHCISSAASDVYKRQTLLFETKVFAVCDRQLEKYVHRTVADR